MARTFDEVLAEVSRQSDPQRKTILNSITDLPNQQVADESALDAKKNQAYDDILSGARRRGVGVAFGGIPLGEQATYNATDYAPAVARLKQSYNDRKGSLETALGDIGKNDYSTAYNIFNTDRQFEQSQRQFEEQKRQFDAQLAESRRQASAAAAASDVSRYFNTGQSQPAQQQAGGSGITAKDQEIYNKAKATANLYQKLPGDFNKFIREQLPNINSSDPATRDYARKYILSSYQQAGLGNAQALKIWGLV